MSAKAVKISVAADQQVSGLWQLPDRARAALVLAHGAGAGMTHPFLVAVADGLASRGLATLRYQFPYFERGSKRPDSAADAQAAVRAAVAQAAQLAPNLPLFAGGKSYGGRMTSQAQAKKPMPAVRGLVFFGFPLHPPGKQSSERGAHLFDVRVRMLFLQGTRDDFAKEELLCPLVERLGTRATLAPIAFANHSFQVPASSGRKSTEVMSEMLDEVAHWTRKAASVAASDAP